MLVSSCSHNLQLTTKKVPFQSDTPTKLCNFWFSMFGLIKFSQLASKFDLAQAEEGKLMNQLRMVQLVFHRGSA